MPKTRTFAGKTYTFPDDATEEEMIEAVEAGSGPEPARVQSPAGADRGDLTPSALSRFGSSFLETINPMNILRGIPAMIPGTDANAEATYARLRAQEDNPFGAALANSPLGQFGGASAGERIAKGEVAEGLGEGAGLIAANAAPAALPGAIRLARPGVKLTGKLVQAAASPQKTMGAIGREIEALGEAVPRSEQLAGLPPPRSTGPVRLAPPREVPPRAPGIEPMAFPEDPLVVDPYMPNRGAGPQTEFGPGALSFDDPLALESATDTLARKQSEGPVRLGRPGPASALPEATGVVPEAAEALESAFPEVDLTEASGGGSTVARERAAERFGRNFVDEGATVPEGRGLPQELLEQAETPSAPVDAAPDLDIPTTKSKNPLSELDNRITQNDLDQLMELLASGMSKEEAVAQMVQARRARSQAYYEQAKLDRQNRFVLERDRAYPGSGDETYPIRQDPYPSSTAKVTNKFGDVVEVDLTQLPPALRTVVETYNKNGLSLSATARELGINGYELSVSLDAARALGRKR